jgi:predicted RNase H-like HicB family nuclease
MSGNMDVIPFLYVDVLYSEEKTFVAECLEIPVIIEAETLDKLESKMKLAIEGFFATFPEECTVVLNKRRCPRCNANNNELTSFPIMSNESFTFDHNDKRGVELEFKHRQRAK